jgi:Fur family transcriptional regulator, ferric uptake regulator
MLQKQMISPTALLKDFHLSHTKIREGLLHVLMKSEVALSAIEISRRMEIECDRVTLYRNLKTFVEKGIAHQIFVDNLESKYVLPDRNTQSGGHSSEHIHFKCVNCSVVQCLHDSPVSEIALPEGFKKLESNYVIFGLCNFCNHKD